VYNIYAAGKIINHSMRRRVCKRETARSHIICTPKPDFIMFDIETAQTDIIKPKEPSLNLAVADATKIAQDRDQ